MADKSKRACQSTVKVNCDKLDDANQEHECSEGHCLQAELSAQAQTTPVALAQRSLAARTAPTLRPIVPYCILQTQLHIRQ
jgi:hypothetical protein